MDTQTNQTQAPQAVPHIRGGDLFLQLGAFAALYSCLGAILVLLFRVIDAAFPPVQSGYSISSFFFGSSTISFQVATLIVFFPVYLVISAIIQRMYAADPARRESRIRRGLIYLTLFVSGAFMAGDLVTVIYSFLNGEDFTTGFVLKALSILVVFAGVFVYYVEDVRGRLTTRSRGLLRILSILLVISSVIWGFSVLGSPRTQRYQRLDQQKASDLQSIQYQVTNYYQSKGMLPNALSDLDNSLSYNKLPKDAQTGLDYEYQKTGNLSFNLCATFNTTPPPAVSNSFGYTPAANDNWQYQKGHYCFTRTIDPQLYPVYNQPVIVPAPVK